MDRGIEEGVDYQGVMGLFLGFCNELVLIIVVNLLILGYYYKVGLPVCDDVWLFLDDVEEAGDFVEVEGEVAVFGRGVEGV